MSSLLSSAVYQAPSRQARLKLNTIIEEFRESQYEDDVVEERGRSRTPSERASPAFSTSTVSSYYEKSRGSRDFDELYDVSEPESDQDSIEIPPSHRRKSSKDSGRSPRTRRYPSLIIPSPTSWPTIEKFKAEAAPGMATSATIPISPEVLAKLNTRCQIASNPPSLDGSQISEQITVSSTPSTPDEFNHPSNVVQWSRMVASSVYSPDDVNFDLEVTPTQHSSMLLSPAAFSVLQLMSHEQDLVETSTGEMQEVVRIKPIEDEPMSATSEYSISAISLPSPGGIFGSTTTAPWNVPSPLNADILASPTFSSVEDFYNSTCQQVTPRQADFSPIEPEVPGILAILNRESTDLPATDRTGDWLCNQNSLIAALKDGVPSTPINKAIPSLPETPESVKRVVRFLDTEVAKEANRIAATEEKGDTTFYHAFQRLSMAASPTDSFIHRHSRFDALQAQRTSLQLNHVNSLLGDYRSAIIYRPAPSRPISMFPGREEEESTLDDDEKQYFAALEREREATEQIAPSMWFVEALRYLSGGSLFNSPVATLLSSAPALESTALPSHVRVLDLGGAPQCDWAWHCAQDFPNVKTYTAILASQTHNPALHGPSNHRLVSVESFFNLPFPDNHFDAISARSLAMYLKTTKPCGEASDEYDLCLRECLRVLKPGGYLEYFILDAELISTLGASSQPSASEGSTSMISAAPLASKLSTEFSLSLSLLGYDANPTKSFLARLKRNGFSSIKRAWMFLPIGCESELLTTVPETPPPTGASLYDEGIFREQLEAVQGPVGCTADAAAVSGLVGGWMWERWVVKLAREQGREVGYKGLLGEVAGVINEGREYGGGWRVLRGWARKPVD